MNDSMISLATTYVLDMLVKNEEVKKFPEEFISASMRWISSWFLEDDPVTKAVVESNKSIEVKKTVIEDKITELSQNSIFMQELKEKLDKYQSVRGRKNMAVRSKIHSEKIKVGDRGKIEDAYLEEKNIIEDSDITSKSLDVGDESY